MRDALAHTQRELLRQYACSNVLLGFDYDGTLAPIVANPDRAPMRPTTRRLLHTLARLYPVVVISGRARADAARFLLGIDPAQIVGNHGIEPWQASEDMVAKVRRWIPELTSRLNPYGGVLIEDKLFSVAIHYRNSRAKKRVRAAALAVALGLGDVRVIGGKEVINILPAGAPHKGIALERERDRLRCDTAIYVGDDETDEDVFALDQPGRLLSIRVGAKRRSSALYYIQGQQSIDKLIQVLIDLRREYGARRQVAL